MKRKRSRERENKERIQKVGYSTLLLLEASSNKVRQRRSGGGREGERIPRRGEDEVKEKTGRGGENLEDGILCCWW